MAAVLFGHRSMSHEHLLGLLLFGELRERAGDRVGFLYHTLRRWWLRVIHVNGVSDWWLALFLRIYKWLVEILLYRILLLLLFVRHHEVVAQYTYCVVVRIVNLNFIVRGNNTTCRWTRVVLLSLCEPLWAIIRIVIVPRRIEVIVIDIAFIVLVMMHLLTITLHRQPLLLFINVCGCRILLIV